MCKHLYREIIFLRAPVLDRTIFPFLFFNVYMCLQILFKMTQLETRRIYFATFILLFLLFV